MSSQCSSYRIEHVWYLPKFLHINFEACHQRLIATVNANALFCALAPIPEALAIFFLALYSVASTWWKFQGFWSDGSRCRLLRNTLLVNLWENILLLKLSGQVRGDGTWLRKHVLLVFDSKNVVALIFGCIITGIVILVSSLVEVLFFREKSVHLLKKII